MLLIVSNSKDATADYLSTALHSRSLSFLRFDTDTGLDQASFKYSDGLPKLGMNGNWYSAIEFRNVWYRRPERLTHPLIVDNAEGRLLLDEWSESLEAFFAHIPRCRWMNHPSLNAAASHKIEQLTTAVAIGFTIPSTLVTQDPVEARNFFEEQRGEIIVKPLSVGYVERSDGDCDSLIYTSRVMEHDLAQLSDLPACPTLLQQFIRKSADVRVTVVDHDVHAVELKATGPDGAQLCDVRRDNMAHVIYKQIKLPNDVERRVRLLTEHYQLRFAAIDMAVDTNGEWIFFEINPNGQWAWLDQVGATDIASSFIRAFSSI
jgi:hypothetical protein